MKKSLRMTPEVESGAVERHRSRVFAFAYQVLSDREEAEDVTQEVLLKLWTHRGQVESERLGAWLRRVTRNACYDLLRRRRVRSIVTAGEDGELTDRAADRAPGPEAHARAAAFRRRLGGELARLPEAQRRAVVLREIRGLTYEEISRTLGVPLNTVRVHIHRGRRRLRERLQEEMTP